MKNLRLALVFYITLLSSFQLSNSLFQPQFSFPSHDSANPIKTLIGNMSHVLGMASRERNIGKYAKQSFLCFFLKKAFSHYAFLEKFYYPSRSFFSYFPHVLLTESSQNGYYKGTSRFPEFHGVFSAFKVSVTGLAVLVV